MAGMASRKWRGLESTTKSYAKSVICAISANLRCIIRAVQQFIAKKIAKSGDAAAADTRFLAVEENVFARKDRAGVCDLNAVWYLDAVV
jgi:hypothetical protein